MQMIRPCHGGWGSHSVTEEYMLESEKPRWTVTWKGGERVKLWETLKHLIFTSSLDATSTTVQCSAWTIRVSSVSDTWQSGNYVANDP